MKLRNLSCQLILGHYRVITHPMITTKDDKIISIILFVLFHSYFISFSFQGYRTTLRVKSKLYAFLREIIVDFLSNAYAFCAILL